MQIHFACEEGTSRSVSRCLSSPPSSEQDNPKGKRYLFLECSSGAIQILNSFFGSRPSGAVGVTSCGLRSNDVVYPTEVQTCDGTSRCYIHLHEQADGYRDVELMYLQVHYRCLDVSALKQDQKPIAGSVSVRDYMSDSDQIASNILSDDAAAVAASSAQASRGASSQRKGIDHTSTIVGGILLGVCVIGSFVIAYVLDQTWKKRERLENSLRSTGNEGGMADDAVAIVFSAETEMAKAKAGSKAVDDAKPVKIEATSADKEVDNEVTESLMDLINIAEARLQLNQSPTLPRKVDHLPEKCRENPPANVRHYIEKGEKQEFYV